MTRRTQRITPVLAIAGVFGLAACGAATPYQPAVDGQGYAELQLEDDRFRVTFSGNRLTARETVENYLLYRAAEITVARGFDHFVVADWEIERSTTYFSTMIGVGGAFGFGRYDVFGDPFGTFGSATARPADRYTGYANIVLRRGARPPGQPETYDARAVLRRLAPAISLPPA